MRIIIYVNNKTDYYDMTYDDFLKQNFWFPLNDIEKLIRFWDRNFKTKYFEFRKKLNDIAISNWKKLNGCIVYEWESLFDFGDDSLFLFTDDDDFYNPDLSQHEEVLNCDCVYWKPAAFVTTVLTPKDKFPDSPFFDFSRKRLLYSNNYGFTKKGLLKIKDRNMLETNIKANQLLESMNTVYLKSHLNLANKTIASLTSLNIINKEKLIDFFTNFSTSNFQIPDDFKWANQQIMETMRLYNENKNRTYLL